MPQNIVEYLRECAINKLFSIASFNNAFSIWKTQIIALTPSGTEHEYFNLGDNLKNIFFSTNTSTSRSQSDVSSGGANWKGLVCWYLNFCNIGRRTVIIKHYKDLIPTPVSDAITVKYGTFPSNTEADLIAITFPDKPEYSMDKNNIIINDIHGNTVPRYKKRSVTYNLLPILNALISRDFNEIEIHIIQCKTNWNDNAQIPMLWDAVYAADRFNNGITVGQNGYSIRNVNMFTYSFVTVPTIKLKKIKTNSICVLRVRNLSGGNYWGLPSQIGIADSIKEILVRNLNSGHSSNHLTTMHSMLPALSTTHSYFNL